MKILYQNREFAVLEVDQVGDKLPEFVMIKVNDYSITYRNYKEIDIKLEKMKHLIENMISCFDSAYKHLEGSQNVDINGALAYLEIYKNFKIEDEIK